MAEKKVIAVSECYAVRIDKLLKQIREVRRCDLREDAKICQSKNEAITVSDISETLLRQFFFT